MSTLKACPFCGEREIEYKSNGGFFVTCSNCGVRMGSSESREAVYKLWNTRVSVSAPVLESKALTLKQLKAREGKAVYTVRNGEVIEGFVKLGNLSLNPIIHFAADDWVTLRSGLKFYDVPPVSTIKY